MSYISSNANRFYCGVEGSFGQVPAIAAHNRFAAVKLGARQQFDFAERKDKTGSRTFMGNQAGGRRRTEFDLMMYMSTWSDMTNGPGYGPLFQAALGATPLTYGGGAVGTSTNASQVGFAAPHGLVVNQAVSYRGELRFVISVIDASTVLVNAPFSATPAAGTSFGPTVTYLLSTDLPSVSIFDYWSPSTAVQRVLSGAAMDKLAIKVHCGYHEFRFQGLAQDLLDSASFAAGEGQLTAFPVEPVLGDFTQTAIPGTLGQAWIGATAQKFLTLTEAQIEVDNKLEPRSCEFGSSVPLAICPGVRHVSMDISLFEVTDEATAELYQAARQRSPITMMLQLGQATGQLCGVQLKSVVPEVPEFDDRECRLKWRFHQSRAQGTVDDEITVAFG
jgi:hypothetical protein